MKPLDDEQKKLVKELCASSYIEGMTSTSIRMLNFFGFYSDTYKVNTESANKVKELEKQLGINKETNDPNN